MGTHERFGLTRVINARGTYTPLGVSRSPQRVRDAVGEALADFYVIDELQAAASRRIAECTGAEAGAVVHCASAAITLSIAACMTGSRADRVAALPDTTGMDNRVVLPAGHAVNYGHPIVQDIRLAGARPLLAGSHESCPIDQLDSALSGESVACLLLVSSRLAQGEPISLTGAVAAAHRRGLPAVIDGAAQDMRIDELLATGADLVLVSAQKYLAGPTAGLVIGRSERVAAVRAQEKGIGRSMKASKEGILGALAALDERQLLDPSEWRKDQERKALDFALRANHIPGIDAMAVPDRVGMPISRVHLHIADDAGITAVEAEEKLRAGEPSIRVMEDDAENGVLALELVPLDAAEIDTILDRLVGLFPERRDA